MMKYKGYLAKTEIDPDSGLIFGEVIGVRDMITFQGYTVPEAVQAFRESVDLYLKTCKEQGLVPDKMYSGAIALRTTSKTHRSLVEIAESRGQSLNQFIERVLRHYIRKVDPHSSDASKSGATLRNTPRGKPYSNRRQKRLSSPEAKKAVAD